jgi:hypothetical protein
MDVILNRSPFIKTEPSAKLPTKKAASLVVGGEDDVLLVRSYHEDDLDDANDFKFCTMILFSPQCGVFYCARERCSKEVGVAKTHVALDMSWLCLERSPTTTGKSRTPSAREGVSSDFMWRKLFHIILNTLKVQISVLSTRLTVFWHDNFP